MISHENYKAQFLSWEFKGIEEELEHEALNGVFTYNQWRQITTATPLRIISMWIIFGNKFKNYGEIQKKWNRSDYRRRI